MEEYQGLKTLLMAVNKQICITWPCGKSIPKTWPNSLTFTFYQQHNDKKDPSANAGGPRDGFDP